MAYTSFDIVSKSGKVIEKREVSCFSCLRDFNLGVKMVSKGKWVDAKTDPIDTIIIYLQNDKGLPKEHLDFYMRYLYSHSYWGTLLVDYHSYKKITVKVGNLGGDILLSILTIIRMVDELPEMVSAFYYLTSLDYVDNLDLAFFLATFVTVDNGKVTILRGRVYNTNHHFLDRGIHSLSDAVSYAKDFPYKSNDDPFNVVFRFQGSFNYFSKSKIGKNMYYFIDGLLESKRPNVFFKNRYLKLQEEVLLNVE